MRFEFFKTPAQRATTEEFLDVDGCRVQLRLVRNLRARRYVLRLRPDGTARVTIPRHGSVAEARRFVERNREWLAQQLKRLATLPKRSRALQVGQEILFRGELVKLEAVAEGAKSAIQFSNVRVPVPDTSADVRPRVEKSLWKLAAHELAPRVFELAAFHLLTVKRVTVRNQKSRWGSCSRRGTISLNWRLIQTPASVRDYIILHELMHLREMNHSARFWREVESVCPDYELAERWLKQHSALLH